MARWIPRTLDINGQGTSQQLFSRQLDRQRWSHPLARAIVRLDPGRFFCVGTGKELLYTTEISTREELLHRIETAFTTMKQEMQLNITTTEASNRCRKCIRKGESHFEN
ncbi:hypothetical protein EVAR_37297_1 [Eumeta japonica]|uniref:Uncharacterized protein n=1 Tax=Eumeta variegata TaxID=151549 RepID=A0A4C1WZ64_EUMVA|nr:hypothetical protein EVAR_37297_1 [Eumeta japonica]